MGRYGNEEGRETLFEQLTQMTRQKGEKRIAERRKYHKKPEQVTRSMSDSNPQAEQSSRRNTLDASISRWTNEDMIGNQLTDLVRRIRLLEDLEKYDKATRAAQQALHEGADEVRLFQEGIVWQRRRGEWFRTDGWREGPRITWSPTLANPE
jgi:hypothetical protein